LATRRLVAAPDLLAAAEQAADLLHKAACGGLKYPGRRERLGEHKARERAVRDLLREAIDKAKRA